MSSQFLKLFKYENEWYFIKNLLISKQNRIKNSIDLQDLLIKVDKYSSRWTDRGYSGYFQHNSGHLGNSATLFNMVNPSVFSEFIHSAIPRMISLVINIGTIITSALKICTSNQRCSYSLQRRQIFVLLSAAFFGLFPYGFQNANLPNLDFSHLYSISSISQGAKVEAILRYFNTMNMYSTYLSPLLYEQVILEKSTLGISSSNQILQSRIPLQKPIIYSGFMENYGIGPVIEAIFANKYAGGGVLGRGSVQEEIKFVIMPELMVARLLFGPLRDSEALIYKNIRQYSSYSGYSNSLRITGDYPNSDNTIDRVYVGIDAVNYSTGKGRYQYTVGSMLRELNKLISAICVQNPGENHVKRYSFVTGHWGCGAFRGDPNLKFILQWIASCYCNRVMVYAHGGRSVPIFSQINKIRKQFPTCGLLWRRLVRRANQLNHATLMTVLS